MISRGLNLAMSGQPLSRGYPSSADTIRIPFDCYESSWQCAQGLGRDTAPFGIENSTCSSAVSKFASNLASRAVLKPVWKPQEYGVQFTYQQRMGALSGCGTIDQRMGSCDSLGYSDVQPIFRHTPLDWKTFSQSSSEFDPRCVRPHVSSVPLEALQPSMRAQNYAVHGKSAESTSARSRSEPISIKKAQLGEKGAKKTWKVILTPELAATIYKLRPGGTEKKSSSVRLSRRYGVSPKTIRDIWNRATWTKATRPLWDLESEEQVTHSSVEAKQAQSKTNQAGEEAGNKCSQGRYSAEEPMECGSASDSRCEAISVRALIGLCSS